jgi:hypothetical protein
MLLANFSLAESGYRGWSARSWLGTKSWKRLYRPSPTPHPGQQSWVQQALSWICGEGPSRATLLEEGLRRGGLREWKGPVQGRRRKYPGVKGNPRVGGAESF